MTQPSTGTPKFELTRDDLAKWAIVALLVVVGVVALMFTRRLIVPVDDLVTGYECTTHGRDELSREALDHERSNRFSLVDRTDGYCVFGPVVEFDEEGEVVQPAVDEVAAADSATEQTEDAPPAGIETLQISLADIETGAFYRGMKIVFIILQLGAASAAVRLIADPLLDRFVRAEPAL
ncbi:MAG: hypothetical protein OEV40_28085 [Acidimicrobiia bacterium]|nr:hypothetical protein [Acidimicrobiia bacterium]